MERDEDDLITTADAAIPRTVFSDKSTVPVAGRKLLSFIEDKLQGRNMRSKQQIRYKRFRD